MMTMNDIEVTTLESYMQIHKDFKPDNIVNKKLYGKDKGSSSEMYRNSTEVCVVIESTAPSDTSLQQRRNSSDVKLVINNNNGVELGKLPISDFFKKRFTGNCIHLPKNCYWNN